MDLIPYIESVLREYGHHGDVQLTPETDLFDLNLDSLDVVEAVMQIEEDLNVEFPDQDLLTVGDLINIIKNANVNEERVNLAFSRRASPGQLQPIDVDKELEIYREKIATLKGVDASKVVISIIV